MSEQDGRATHRPPRDDLAGMSPYSNHLALERRVCPNCRYYFDVDKDSDDVFCSDACRNRHEDGVLLADGGRATSHWDLHCSRCGDEYPADRENALCESCVKNMQMSKLMDGVLCERCDGEGWIYGTWCDLERAMNGRDTRCPECHGTGRVAWEPDLDDVHPDLRSEVKARA